MILLGPGDDHFLIGAVKRRLGVVPNDDHFCEALEARVRGAQMLLGIEQTGLIEDELLELLHVTRPRQRLT